MRVKNISKKRWMLGVSCYQRLDDLVNFLEILSAVDFLEVYVWEGLSKNSEALIRPYLREQMSLGSIAGFFSFDGNIGANCARLASQVLMDQGDYDFVTITNPDLVFDPSIFEEIHAILEGCPEVFTVSSGISKENIPVAVAEQYPEEKVLSKKPYNLFKSGAHLTTFRASEFQDFLAWRRAVSVPFVDRSFETFGTYVKNKYSACTKLCKATHTGWSIEDDAEYRKLKLMNSRRNFWWLNLEVPFTFYRSTKREVYFRSDLREYFTPIRWHLIILKNDLENECSLRLECRWVDGSDMSVRSVNISPGEIFEYKVYLFGGITIHRVDHINCEKIHGSVFVLLDKASFNFCLPVSAI